MQDPQFLKRKEEVKKGMEGDFRLKEDGTLIFRDRICVPQVENLREQIMEEAHCFAYAMHPGATKMYHNLKQYYWWPGMKKDIAKVVSKCLVCQ